MVELEQRETRLKTRSGARDAHVAHEYDFILLDCPPALNLLTVNGLVAADAVLIPMQCEYYALEGLSDLINTIKKVRQHLNPQLEIEGLLRTMFDPRNTLSQQVSEQLEQHFGDKVYGTIIPRNVRLAEAPSTASRRSTSTRPARARRPISRSPARSSAGRSRAQAAPRRDRGRGPGR